MLSSTELYRRIASATTRFEFTAPVEPGDLATFEAALLEALRGPRADAVIPPGCSVRVATSPQGVRVEVFQGDLRRYDRTMLVSQAVHTSP